MLVVASLATVSMALAEDLSPGSKAPSIQVKEWVKGHEVKAFDAGKTYVVEFWATWCGPCIQSIPHLTEVAHKHKDVTFVGVSIWEDGTEVKKFVEKMGDKMDYNVAYGGNTDGMAESWMAAAGQRGIPTAFIVQDSKIRWIGHPMEIEKPLDEVVAGTFDDAAFKKDFDAKTEASRKEMAVQNAIAAADKLHDEGKVAEAKAALDKAEKDYNIGKEETEGVRTMWLATDDPAKFKKTMTEWASGGEDKLQQVASTAMQLAADKKATKQSKDLACEVVEIALKKGADNFIVNWYAMNVYDQAHQAKKGLAIAKKLEALLPKSEYKDNEGLVTALKEAKAKLEKEAGNG